MRKTHKEEIDHWENIQDATKGEWKTHQTEWFQQRQCHSRGL